LKREGIADFDVALCRMAVNCGDFSGFRGLSTTLHAFPKDLLDVREAADLEPGQFCRY